MDILARFIHVERPEKGSAAARRPPRRSSSPATTSGTPCWPWRPPPRPRAPGTNYLVQHSAGSGKSNTIAWTAHRLSNLHDAADTRSSTRSS